MNETELSICIRSAYQIFTDNAPMASLYPELVGTGEAFEAHKLIQDQISYLSRIPPITLARMDWKIQGMARAVMAWERAGYIPEKT